MKKNLIYYSTFGEIRTVERLFKDEERSYIRILPDHLGIGDKGYTKRLQRAVSDFGFERSFAKAVKGLEEHYGFSLPVSGVAQTTLAHAQKIAGDLDQRERTLCLPAKGVETIIAEADGSFVPIVSTQGEESDKRKNRQVNYQEARLCACQAQGSMDCFYEATFQEVDQVGKLWAECAKTAGQGLNTGSSRNCVFCP